jgi:hypothetical protein
METKANAATQKQETNTEAQLVTDLSAKLSLMLAKVKDCAALGKQR